MRSAQLWRAAALDTILVGATSGLQPRADYHTLSLKHTCLLAGAGDNGIRIFEQTPQADGTSEESGAPPSYSCVATAAAAHDLDVNCVRWHPKDATLLASAGDDGSIKLWRYVREWT